MRLHGKRHKSDSYYFRWHYGKQRRVCITKEYVDRPTEKQVSAREAFTALRREVARQLRDADLRAAWEARFKKNNEGYKMLHTYVYEMMKRGESVISRNEPAGCLSRRCTASSLQVNSKQETHIKGVSTSPTPVIVVYNGVIVPIFLRSTVPIERDCSG